MLRGKDGKHLPEKKKRAVKVIKVEWPTWNTTKAITWFILINSVAWVWFSYILAALDKIQIAESLSSTAVTSIIGVVFAYCIKSGFENISKNNCWPDKSHTDNPPVG